MASKKNEKATAEAEAGTKAEANAKGERGAGGGARGDGGLPREALEGHERADLPIELVQVDTAFNIDPERSTNEENVRAMVDDIREKGLLQPLVVYAERSPSAKGGWSFKLLAGFIRHAALVRLGYKVVPVVVKRDLTALQQHLVNGAENIRRKSVHPFCASKHFLMLRDVYKMPVADIAKTYGYSTTYVESLIETYETTPDSIRDSFFKNLNVDPTRVPAFSWILGLRKHTPAEKIEAYERKYGSKRDAIRASELEEGEPEALEDKPQRPRRRNIEALEQAIYKTLMPPHLGGKAVEGNVKGIEGDWSQRDRLIAKAVLYWAHDTKKPCPWREKKVKPAPEPRRELSDPEDLGELR